MDAVTNSTERPPGGSLPGGRTFLGFRHVKWYWMVQAALAVFLLFLTALAFRLWLVDPLLWKRFPSRAMA